MLMPDGSTFRPPSIDLEVVRKRFKLDLNPPGDNRGERLFAGAEHLGHRGHATRAWLQHYIAQTFAEAQVPALQTVRESLRDRRVESLERRVAVLEKRVAELDRKRADETLWRRALSELDIRLIAAHSPQAKGRVERSHGTDQDRLIKKLRLTGVRTIAAASYRKSIGRPVNYPRTELRYTANLLHMMFSLPHRLYQPDEWINDGDSAVVAPGGRRKLSSMPSCTRPTLCIRSPARAAS